MRTRFLALAVAALVVLGAVSADADAGTIKMILESDYRAGSGGEFTVRTFTGMTPVPMGPGVASPNGFYQTFCVEVGQHFSPGTTYDWTLSTNSDRGTGPSGQIDLAAETAYLYTQFYRGELGGSTPFDLTDDYVYTPGAGRQASAVALQTAIWHLQGGQVSAPGGLTLAGKWVAEARAAVTGSWGDTIGSVRILNLTRTVSGVTTWHQDQVVMVPLPGVAFAGLGLLAGIGLIDVARRRRHRRLM